MVETQKQVSALGADPRMAVNNAVLQVMSAIFLSSEAADTAEVSTRYLPRLSHQPLSAS